MRRKRKKSAKKIKKNRRCRRRSRGEGEYKSGNLDFYFGFAIKIRSAIESETFRTCGVNSYLLAETLTV